LSTVSLVVGNQEFNIPGDYYTTEKQNLVHTLLRKLAQKEISVLVDSKLDFADRLKLQIRCVA